MKDIRIKHENEYGYSTRPSSDGFTSLYSTTKEKNEDGLIYVNGRFLASCSTVKYIRDLGESIGENMMSDSAILETLSRENCGRQDRVYAAELLEEIHGNRVKSGRSKE